MLKKLDALRLFCLALACAAALCFPHGLFAQSAPARQEERTRTQGQRAPARQEERTQVQGERAPARQGERTRTQGQRAPARQGERTQAQVERAPARQEERTRTQGQRAPARQEERTRTQGQRAPTRQGERTQARQGERAPARQGERTQARQGQSASARQGERTQPRQRESAASKPADAPRQEKAQQDEPSRIDILRYALDSEIIELIDKLIQEESSEYNDEIYSLFSRSRNESLKESIFRFFAAQKNPILENECAEILDDPYEVKRALLAAAASYAGEIGATSALPQLRSLAESGNYDFASSAVKAIAKIGSKSDAAFLANLMREDFFDNEKQRLVFRQDIITALSSLDCSDIRDELVGIVGDGEENAVIRAGAASALANLSNNDDVEAIAALFSESDPVLRAGAVSALSNFASSQTAKDVVLEAFKDSHYKVREEALAAAEKMDIAEAVSYTLYRAKTDPAESVKLKAYESLGAMGTQEGRAFLSEVLNDEKAGGKMRVKAADVLLKYYLDTSLADVAAVAEAALADNKQSWLCQELGKLIARIETQSSSGVAAAYLASSNAVAQNLGLDMYEKNKYAQVREKVEEIAANDKAGALQRRAEKILNGDGASPAPKEQK